MESPASTNGAALKMELPPFQKAVPWKRAETVFTAGIVLGDFGARIFLMATWVGCSGGPWSWWPSSKQAHLISQLKVWDYDIVLAVDFEGVAVKARVACERWCVGSAASAGDAQCRLQGEGIGFDGWLERRWPEVGEIESAVRKIAR